MEEAALIRALRRGDPAALETLLIQYSPFAAAVAAHILRGCPQDTEEVVSDAFLALWDNAHKLRPRQGKGLPGDHCPQPGQKPPAAAGSGAPCWRRTCWRSCRREILPRSAWRRWSRRAWCGTPWTLCPRRTGDVSAPLLLRPERLRDRRGHGAQSRHNQNPAAPGPEETEGIAFGKGVFL